MNRNRKEELARLAARELPGLPRSIFIGVVSQLDEAIGRSDDNIDELTSALLKLGITGVVHFNAQLGLIRQLPGCDDRELERLAIVGAGKLIGAGFTPDKIDREIGIIREKIEAHAQKIAATNRANAEAVEASRRAVLEEEAKALQPHQIVAEAEACGVELFVDSGAIRARPAHRLGSPHIERIRLRQGEVARFLQERSAGAPIC